MSHPSINSSEVFEELHAIFETIPICGEHVNGLCVDEEWSSRGYVVYTK